MRWIYYAAIAFLLVAMMQYSYSQHDKYHPAISEFLENPEKYDGMMTEQHTRIYNATKDSFMIRAGNEYVTVKYNGVKEPKYGTLTFVGYYKKEGYIEATRIRCNNYEYGKYIFSALGLLLFLFMFFREWRITIRGFENA